MKDDGSAVVLGAGALAFVVVASIWWLSREIGVSMEDTMDFVGRGVGVVVFYLLASWGASSAGMSNPWQFLVPGFWWASWPLIVAKGTTTPDFMARYGADLEFVWWASPGFRWVTLLATLGLAFWLYVRKNSYR